jgi:tetratricopeptide (TPR) repeat protein
VVAAVLAGALVLATFALPRGTRGEPSQPAGALAGGTLQSTNGAGDSGGIAVRKLVWRNTLALAAAHPFTGVGPGQFAREFPPYRAPEEIELSSHQRRLAQETEVEHAHCDYLTIAAEGGLVWAAGALVLLAAIALAAWRTLRARAEISHAGTGERTTDCALAAAALALLANAAVHGVLFHDAVSSSLAFGVFGALLGPVRGTPRLVRKLVPGALLALALLAAAPALATLRHASALAPIHRGRELSSDATERAIASALAAVPDSPPALSLRARLLEMRHADPALIAAAWADVCSVRPNRVEANVQLGLAQLEAGAPAEADASWSRAQALDPGHPGVLWNRMTLALESERVDDAAVLCDTLARAGRLDRERLVPLAARLELEAHTASAQFAWTRALPEVAEAGPERTFQLARERREAGDTLAAAALELRAQRTWGREHADAQRWDDAVRSYRQLLRAAATGGRTPSPRFVFEYAAALSRAGKDGAAEVTGLALDATGFAALPEWARACVSERGWFTP